MLKGFIGLVVFVILMSVIVFKMNCTRMDFAEEGIAVFCYGKYNLSSSLSEDELNRIKEIFTDKFLYQDSLFCGFMEDVAIQINDSQTFCIACDTCPIIYWKEKERYFQISEEEKIQLYQLLEAHGFFFPCV